MPMEDSDNSQHAAAEVGRDRADRSMPRRILVAFAWLLGGIVGLTAVAYLVGWAINWRDRPPSAAALHFEQLYRERPAVADEENAYIYLMGFGAPHGEDPLQMGLKRLAWIRQAGSSAPLDHAKDPLQHTLDFQANRHPEVRKLLETCHWVASACVAALSAVDETYEPWIASESALLERYRTWIAHTGWREQIPSRLDAPWPSFGAALEGQKLLLLQARVLAEKGDHAAVRALLESDIRFWRTVLASADTLLPRMVAVAALHQHFKWGSQILQALPSGIASAVMPVEWQVEISKSERSMLRCMVGEWYHTSEILKSTLAEDALQDAAFFERVFSRMTMPFFKLQDTINRLAESRLQMIELLDVPYSRYEAAIAQLEERVHGRQTNVSFTDRFYNMGGAMLLDITDDYSLYARRIVDLEGIRRAALLTTMLHEANTGTGQVASVIEASELRNPYDDQPFVWSEADGAIVFRGLEPGERGEHRFYYVH